MLGVSKTIDILESHISLYEIDMYMFSVSAVNKSIFNGVCLHSKNSSDM